MIVRTQPAWAGFFFKLQHLHAEENLPCKRFLQIVYKYNNNRARYQLYNKRLLIIKYYTAYIANRATGCPFVSKAQTVCVQGTFQNGQVDKDIHKMMESFKADKPNQYHV
jgi:hypothetical protein